jgi:hypothetical protein
VSALNKRLAADRSIFIFKFNPPFFSVYQLSSDSDSRVNTSGSADNNSEDNDDDDIAKCKLSMKVRFL